MFQSDSGNRTFITATRENISGAELKKRNGMMSIRLGHERPVRPSNQFLQNRSDSARFGRHGCLKCYLSPEAFANATAFVPSNKSATST